MRPLSASDLLDIWERGAGRTLIEQALAILGAAFPQASAETLASLNIAQRDAALFHLHDLTFGPQLKGLVACPSCGEQLELAFDTAELRSAGLLPEREAADPERMESSGTGTSLKVQGYQVDFRLPTSGDLARVAPLTDQSLARQRLLETCLIAVRRGNRDVSVNKLPAKVLDAIVAGMEQAAPLANLTVSSTCPSCGHTWEIVLDIVSYFWSEIDAWAVRMLHEVHTLACVYGWREADILAMSAWRRQRYLELIGV